VLVLRRTRGREPKTLQGIGKRLGLTRERIRQIELESLRRLARLQKCKWSPHGAETSARLGTSVEASVNGFVPPT
jgi:hypothetical protein